MQEFHFRHNHLTAGEVTASKMHRLHQVKLFFPAICHITHGTKVIVQDDNRLEATRDELIIIPANTAMEIINQPVNGLFHSDLLMLSPEIVAEFKAHYLKSWPRTTLHSLCAPLSEGLAFMWDNLLHAVRQDLPEALQKHQAFGLLLALLHDGVAGPLLIERNSNLTEQVRQFIMLSPARAWTAQDVASRLALSVPTLRRRLREESQSFRQIVEDVRMAVALSQLQSTRLPIGEIALQCGYLSSSRFTARFRQHYGCLPKTLR
ncbi:MULTISPECIES: AraC family transcriptional regulator [Enterobacter]|uniref:AraC family transcriptional regulator n=1 Tax=Enterobacter TaxID=547 RepID=UPI000EF99DBF|nr:MULTISPECIES: AraC family transcriptional regulator [Enterobacter]RMA88783.1 AraC-like DNA-binding protein [Enterobacter sp. WP_7_1]RMA98755.1 AraC-like DNA-binding protein [Enterobacter sp. WP_7_2]WNI50859.1 AraC family transcriptional regulator [Enterobacter asburiae]